MTFRQTPRPGIALTVLMAAAVAGLGLAGCTKGKAPAPGPPRASLTITVAPARIGTLNLTVEASGTIAAWQDISVGAETGGLTVVRLLADEGDYVRQGQLLLRMNDSLLVAQKRQREAGVASARATLAQVSADLARARDLKAQGYLAQAALDKSTAAEQTAAANLDLAQASLTETLARLDQASVRAPAAGLIAQRSVVAGQIVTAGSPLFRLVRDGRLELNAQVPETELAAVRPGQSAVVSTSEVGQTAGRVRIVTPQIDPQTRVGLARVALIDRGAFRPGMFAKAVINVGAHQALLVGQSSVVYRDNRPGLFVVDAGGVAHFRPVVTGARSGPEIEIRGGLKAGERVAVQGAGFLSEGDRVKVVAAQGAGAR
ncbi:MAG: efflux RND transporter periplasmic adaptor subunit [Caulobacter sp.]|nr:efflux RND transporter periplasmic adaptor subunit [Caulobacter sp.]